MNIEALKKEFHTIFHAETTPRIFFAPGRINLIGEHTDYNGGYVLPAALSFGTYALGVRRKDKKFRFYSMNFPEKGIVTCDITQLIFDPADDWANYPKGMIQLLREHTKYIQTGADILFYGNIPNRAGLSSSASIEMVTGILLKNLYQLKVSRLQLIQLGQKVENTFIGVNSGIMDQFAIGMGKTGQAILLNCQSLEYKYAPLHLENYVILIINTNKHRQLASSKYNQRRSECEHALKALQSKLPIQSLCELTREDFDANKHVIRNKVIQKRARHVVYENARTLDAVQSLQEHDLQQFGELMNASHQSLQQDYEVTGLELDTVVETAWGQEGVLGARMTGAGFGGCAIAIVKKDKVNFIINRINKIYVNTIGYNATFYTAVMEDGAKELSEGVL